MNKMNKLNLWWLFEEVGDDWCADVKPITSENVAGWICIYIYISGPSWIILTPLTKYITIYIQYYILLVCKNCKYALLNTIQNIIHDSWLTIDVRVLSIPPSSSNKPSATCQINCSMVEWMLNIGVIFQEDIECVWELKTNNRQENDGKPLWFRFRLKLTCNRQLMTPRLLQTRTRNAVMKSNGSWMAEFGPLLRPATRCLRR